MFKTIDETRQWIHDLLPHGIKPGIERMQWMLNQLDHPEKRLRVIHVGGTNGKGSTVTYLRQIYQDAGYTVGTFTSPYIEHFNERITVDGKWIEDADLIKAANIVYPLAEQLANSELGTPTEFEIITMMSIVYFSSIERCDLVIYEVGLGGRFDSTNVITPLVSVITNIGMDHMKQLGNSIKEIAFEKAGIIKSGVGVVTAAENPEALAVLEESAGEKHSRYYQFGKSFHVEILNNTNAGIKFNYTSVFKSYDDLEISLKGVHQIKNAATALMVVDYLGAYYALIIEENIIRKALLKAFWPGRFEKVLNEPTIILDGAHNEEGALSLANAIKDYYSDAKVHMVYAGLSDKKHEKMLDTLSLQLHSLTLTTFDFPRAMGESDLRKIGESFNAEVIGNYKDAIMRAKSKITKDDVLIITGSLYFISEARRFLLNNVEK